MNINSGPSSDRLRRAGIRTAVLLAVGAWFAYDGWIGYPRQNRQEFSEQYAERPDPATVPINPEVTSEIVRQLEPSMNAEEVEKRLGPPAMKTDLDARWFGPAGTLVVPLRGGGPTFKSAKRTATDLLVQKGIAVLLLGGFIVSLGFMLAARQSRYILDDRGLTLPKLGTIGWDAIQKLDGERVEEKGWVELHYAEGSETRTARLDAYDIAAFGEMIDAICERKGFENPLPVKSG
jgi:hypothetical protein